MAVYHLLELEKGEMHLKNKGSHHGYLQAVHFKHQEQSPHKPCHSPCSCCQVVEQKNKTFLYQAMSFVLESEAGGEWMMRENVGLR